MRLQIDQSGRVEYTSHKTVIAYSNDKHSSVVITAQTKRKIQEIFRRRGMPKLFALRTFAAAVSLLLKNIVDGNRIDRVIIDREYPGNERVLTDMISEIMRRMGFEAPSIAWAEIGKKSPAHFVAYGVFKNKKQPDKIISFEELLNWAFKTKTTEGRKT